MFYLLKLLCFQEIILKTDNIKLNMYIMTPSITKNVYYKHLPNPENSHVFGRHSIKLKTKPILFRYNNQTNVAIVR